MENGAGILDGFVICLLGKLTLIGKELVDRFRRLEPVYQLDVYVVRKPLRPGEVGLGEIAGFIREAMPLLSFSSISSYPIGDAPVYLVSNLSRGEQRALAACVAGCQDFIVKARAAEIGVTIETNIPPIEIRS